MALRAELHPARRPLPQRAAKIHALVVWRSNIPPPKQPDISETIRVLARNTTELEIDVMRLGKPEPRPALQKKRRSRRLMQLCLIGTDAVERHRRIARLKEDLLPPIRGAIENMLVIQSGDTRHKQRSIAVRVLQAPEPIVASPVTAVGRVVADHGFQVTTAKGVVAHSELANLQSR